MNRAERRRIARNEMKTPEDIVRLVMLRACAVLHQEFGFGEERQMRFIRAMEGRENGKDQAGD